MNLNTTLRFNRLREDAEKQFDLADSQLNQLETTLVERMGGRTKGKLIATIVFGFVWLLFFLLLPFILKGNGRINGIVDFAAFSADAAALRTFFTSAAEISSIVLCLLMAFSNLALYKHYSVILAALDRIKELHNQVSLGRGAIPSGMDMLSAAQKNQFNLQIQASSSVAGEVKAIDGQLSNLEAMHSGFVKWLQRALYIVAGLAWVAVGFLLLGATAARLCIENFDFSDGVAAFIVYGGGVAALIGEFVLLMRAKKGTEVTNVSLMAVAAAPLMYVIATAALVICAWLLWLAWQIVKWVLVIFVGGAILLGVLGG